MATNNNLRQIDMKSSRQDPHGWADEVESRLTKLEDASTESRGGWGCLIILAIIALIIYATKN